MFKLNKIFAVLVFAVAAAWVLTGKFSSVGSEMHEGSAVAAVSTEGAAAAEDAAADPAAGETEADSPRKVRVAEVPLLDYQRKIRISGFTDANKRVILAARSSGMVRTMDVTEGDVVAEGDVLLQLDIEGRDLALSTAEQLLTQRKADAEAYRRLLASGDMPELQVNAAMTALREAESQVEMARIELDRTRVSAPFAGILDAVDGEVGTWVSQGTPVATLLQLDPLVALVEINENSLGLIGIGDGAKVHLANGQDVSGTVRFISRDASVQTRTYRVEVEVPNPGNSLPSGMSAEIEFLSRPEKATILPRSVVLLNDEGILGVRLVDDAGKVSFQPAEILDDTAEGLVLQGIPDGARIIVLGQNFVQDGDMVEATLETAGLAPESAPQ
jgi:multidrug efflux system membrane fusion protein